MKTARLLMFFFATVGHIWAYLGSSGHGANVRRCGYVFSARAIYALWPKGSSPEACEGTARAGAAFAAGRVLAGLPAPAWGGKRKRFRHSLHRMRRAQDGLPGERHPTSGPTPLADIRMGKLKVVAATGAVGRSLVAIDEARCIGCGLCLYEYLASPRVIEIVPTFHDPAITGQ